MSIELASAARIGPVEFVFRLDSDLARPAVPSAPIPLDGEDPDAFTARCEEFRDVTVPAYQRAEAAFERRLAAARETQAWADVFKPEGDRSPAGPTIFVCRQIPWRQWERWCSIKARYSLSATEAAGTLLRMALVEVRGGGWPSTFRVPSPKEHMLPDPENPARVTATGLGKIAPVELLESFAEIIKNGDLCADVIEDIGLQIHNHRMGAPGN